MVEDEIDLHGLSVEEALERLSYFLDAAVVNRLGFVKVIHGHGTGKVRRAVRQALERHRGVRGFHFAPPAEGGPGATIVHMNEN